MKRLIIALMLLLMAVASNAVATECEDNGYARLNRPATIAALSGKRILAKAPDGEEWNEDHCAGGALYKVGDGSIVDPRAFRGTWAMGGGNPAPVTYNYTVGGTSSFTWRLYGNASGGLCWEDSGGTLIATAPTPGSAGTPCN